MMRVVSEQELANRLMELLKERFMRLTKVKLSVDVDDEKMHVEMTMKRVAMIDVWNRKFEEYLEIHKEMEQFGYLKYIRGEHNNDYGCMEVELYGRDAIYGFLYAMLNPFIISETKEEEDDGIYM